MSSGIRDENGYDLRVYRVRPVFSGRDTFRRGNAPRDIGGAALMPLRSAIDRALRSGVQSPDVRPKPHEWIEVLKMCAKALESQASRSAPGGARGTT